MRDGFVEDHLTPKRYAGCAEIFQVFIYFIGRLAQLKAGMAQALLGLFPHPQENKVFLLMLKGLGNKDTGKELGIFSDTAKKYRAQVLEKMQVTNLRELLALWQGIEPEM